MNVGDVVEIKLQGWDHRVVLLKVDEIRNGIVYGVAAKEDGRRPNHRQGHGLWKVRRVVMEGETFDETGRESVAART